jgi:hypothetical protein
MGGKGKTTSGKKLHVSIRKRTSQGGNPPKTSTMNKTKRRNYKKYRGQGK